MYEILYALQKGDIPDLLIVLKMFGQSEVPGLSCVLLMHRIS